MSTHSNGTFIHDEVYVHSMIIIVSHCIEKKWTNVGLAWCTDTPLSYRISKYTILDLDFFFISWIFLSEYLFSVLQ